MVEWKGRLESDAGTKAKHLDRVENFQVPNFFVVTSSELEDIFGPATSRERLLNASVDSEHEEKLKDAYSDIGMSSEVRNANGRAKNLVGGQRNNQLVSVRVSKPGRYSYRLNVGSSDLIDAIREVAASHVEKEGSMPPVIVQKMVEPEYSGAAVSGDYDSEDLVEVVEGLGSSLEEGKNYPYLYVRDDEVKARLPQRHRKVTRNPINGSEKEKQVEPQLPFEKSEIEELLDKLDEGLNIKFAYKRGDFYVVDAWREDPEHEILEDEEIQGVKVSAGRINGVVGRDILYTEETTSPDNYESALVARQGGYTSRDAERAREAEKPAVFGFSSSLSNGQRIRMNSGRDQTRADSHVSDSAPEKEEPSSGGVTGSEVLELDPEGRGLHLSPPYREGYVLSDREVEGAENIPEQGYIDSYSKAFSSDAAPKIVDARKLEREGLREALEYLDDELILIVDELDTALLEHAIRHGAEAFAAEQRKLERLEKAVERAERKFMISELRDGSN